MWLELWEVGAFVNQAPSEKERLYKYAVDFGIKEIDSIEEANKVLDEYMGDKAKENYFY